MSDPPDYYEYEGSRRVPRWLAKKTPTKAVGYEQPLDSGISVSAATDALQAAPDLDRFTEVFDHTVDDGHGAFAQMHQFLESAANWCHNQGALGAANELGLWAIRLEELIEDVRLLPESLSVEFATAATRSSPAAATRSPATAQPAAANVAKPASQTQGPVMDSTPDSPASPDPATADPMLWQQHISALAAAADGIKQASDAWDAVSDSFCDHYGWPIDEKGYADGKVTRDAEGWKHVEVFLAHGPEVLAGVRATALGSDYVEGPISDDLRRLHGIDTTLERAGQIRHEWDQVMELMDASLPGSRELYASHAQEIRNSEGWHYADELAFQGLALARAGDYLTNRASRNQPSQTKHVQAAALARSTSGNRGASTAGPPAPPASNPSAPRRSR